MTHPHLQHSGRGGAGNVDDRASDNPAANEPDAFPPELHGKYSTGRGGFANVQNNDAGPHVARIAQDLEGSDRTVEDQRLLDTTLYSGRGGAGNIKEARRSREASRSRGGTPKTEGEVAHAHDVKHQEGLADKLKHALQGHHS